MRAHRVVASSGILWALWIGACGGSSRVPPPRHGITADDPTPSLPTYTPAAPQVARDPTPTPGPSSRPVAQYPAPPGAATYPGQYPYPAAAASTGSAEAPPPDAPPENVFGYDQPAQGCFEGRVYALEHFTARVPTDYSGLRQLATLYACEWNIPQRSWQQGFPQLPQRFEWFAIRYQGEFQVAQGGVHRFRLHSDDGARLTIDGQLVVDNDGLHTARSASGEITLAPGTHSLTLDYFQGPPVSIALQLFVTSPGRAEQIFTSRTALAAR